MQCENARLMLSYCFQEHEPIRQSQLPDVRETDQCQPSQPPRTGGSRPKKERSGLPRMLTTKSPLTGQTACAGHIAKSHPGCSQGPQMVAVPPYRAFRYCLVPGCRYRTASDRQHRLHMRGTHPAWFAPPQAPVATTSSPAAVTASSTARVTPTVAGVTSAPANVTTTPTYVTAVTTGKQLAGGNTNDSGNCDAAVSGAADQVAPTGQGARPKDPQRATAPGNRSRIMPKPRVQPAAKSSPEPTFAAKTSGSTTRTGVGEQNLSWGSDPTQQHR